MSKAEKRKYTQEFRVEAVKLVLEQGMTLEGAAERLALPKGTLSNWVIAAKRGDGQPVAPGSRSVSELEVCISAIVTGHFGAS